MSRGTTARCTKAAGPPEGNPNQNQDQIGPQATVVSPSGWPSQFGRREQGWAEEGDRKACPAAD